MSNQPKVDAGCTGCSMSLDSNDRSSASGEDRSSLKDAGFRPREDGTLSREEGSSSSSSAGCSFDRTKESRDEESSLDSLSSSLTDGKSSAERSKPKIKVSASKISSTNTETLVEEHGKNSVEGSKPKIKANVPKPSRTNSEAVVEERRKKEKRRIGSLRTSLERKMGTVERILEGRVEKILEENMEKHPWLQPIESWIADRHRNFQGHFGVANSVTLLDHKRRNSRDLDREEEESKSSTSVSEGNESTKTSKSERRTSEERKKLVGVNKDVNEEKETITEVVCKVEEAADGLEKEVQDFATKIERDAIVMHDIVERTKELESRLQDVRQKSRDVDQVLIELESEQHRGESQDRSYKSSQDELSLGSQSISHSVQSYDFKYTPGSKDGDDDEAKLDSRVLEYIRNARKNPNLRDKSNFDIASLISRIKKMESNLRSTSAEDLSIDPTGNMVDGILDVKEVKHPDLLDRLKDNVKGRMEDIHRYFQRTNRLADVNRRLKSQIWSSVVTIVLVEAKNLLPMDIDGLSDPYVKFRLGTEKYKSKVVNKTLNPVWLEQFDLHLYEDPYLGQELEVTVWDRDRSHQDDLMGRTVIDLAVLERETTHRLWRDLEDGSGSIFLLLTISGTTASETISDLAAHEDTPHETARLLQRYSLVNSLQRPRDVGHLTVKVYRAQGLAAADLGGKSDPFCVLELVNSRLQTQTEYKTLAPNWQKIFTFNVKDINSVLEVTVYDEDRDHKVEFLGKVAIPLLRIRNGEKRWYALKDKKLRGRAKGNSPQILLEMTVVWNMVRACIRTLNPKEKKYMEPEMKFKRQVFLRNVLRLKAIIMFFIDLGKYIQSCWEWESKTRSIVALVLFIFGCYYFEPYMIPAAALLILLKYYLVAMVTGAPLTHPANLQDATDVGSDDGPTTPGDDDDDEDDKDKEEKKSLKERLQAIQEVTQTVQNSIGYIASLCERVKNLFNFTIPCLSYLAMLLAILGACVLYFIPVRYLILAWGVNKFSRKIVRPHSVPNNEVLDLISRVPDDEELLNYRELKPLPTADCERGTSGAGTSGAGNATRREMRRRHKMA